MMVHDVSKKQEALRKLIPVLEKMIADDDLYGGVVFLERKDGSQLTISLHGQDSSLISLALLGMVDVWKIKTVLGIQGQLIT